jgi:hypothetical protein
LSYLRNKHLSGNIPAAKIRIFGEPDVKNRLQAKIFRFTKPLCFNLPSPLQRPSESNSNDLIAFLRDDCRFFIIKTLPLQANQRKVALEINPKR